MIHVAAGAGIRTPDSVALDRPNRYHAAENGADFVVVTHPDFSSAIAPLLSHRTARGLRTFKADIDEIYDGFSFGEFDPAAIKEFLRRAYHDWTGLPPQFALLVGDASYDYRDYRRKGGMFVPTQMIPAVYYRTASDNWFAAVDGEDELPDLAIGRLPVRTSAQATIWVDKIISYETHPGAVSKKLVFVGDNPDSTFNFQASSDELARLAPAGFVTEKLYLGPMSSGQVRSATLQRFDEGVLLIHYSGHGAITQWANERLLHESDWVSLRNTGRYPFVFVTNCLSGNFASPFYRSIAETFTHSGPRGAIGFFASTGVNTPFGQHQMAQEAYKLLWAGQTQIGPLVTMAKNRIGADGSHLDIIRSWVLIGDPALRLAYPR